MMATTGTIGRYMSWRFLLAMVSVFAVCMVLIFLVDLVELLRQTGKRGAAPGAVLVWIALLRLPSYSELILPFAALIGGMAGFLMLSRSSELIVVRAVGMSVWQFIMPGLAVALALGAAAVFAYNPLAAFTRAESERIYADVFGKQASLLSTKTAGAWLRQDGSDGHSVIHARIAANHGLSLRGVSVLQYDKADNFVERIEAERAELRDGRWDLHNVWVSAVGREAMYYNHYIVSTFLTVTQVRNSFGSAGSMSFWDLPDFIETADKAGLPATKHKLHYQMLMSRPLLLAVMVLLAATCSLRAFRFGKIQTMLIAGLCAGFGFVILSETSRKLGLSGVTTPEVAAWAPVAVTGLLALTVLLHQEDG